MVSIHILKRAAGVLAFAFVLSAASSHPIPALQNEVISAASHIVSRSGTSSSKVLGFDGNPDLYGIGIRLGYYTQALSLWIANWLVPHEAPFLQTTSTLFMIALFLGICFLSWKPDGCYGVEVFLLMHISYATARIGTDSYKNFSRTHIIIRDLVVFATALYATWYWYTGIGTMRPTPGGVSDVYILYNRGDLYGWIRVAFKVIMPFALTLRTVRLWCSIHYSFQRASLDKLLTNRFYEQLQVELLRELAERSDDPAEKLAFATGSNTLGLVDTEQSQRSRKHIDDLDALGSPSAPAKVLRRTRSLSPSGLQRSQTGRSLGSLSEISPIASQKRGVPPPPPYASSIELPPRKRSKDDPILPALLIASNYYYSIFASNPKYLYERLSSPKPLRRWRSFPRLTFLPTVMHHFITNPVFYSQKWAYVTILLNFSSIPSPTEQLTSHHGSSLNMIHAMMLVSRFQSLCPIKPRKRPKNRWCSPEFLALFDIFGIYATLVINIELTLQWNGIRGVQNLDSVGQFLPSCFGVGGLVKVLWSGVNRSILVRRRRREGIGDHEHHENEHIHHSSVELETARLWRRLREDLYKVT